jgi:hypothetical protein
MTTIKNFESALGRKIQWASRISYSDDHHPVDNFERRLRIYPHALRESNAFYHPGKRALLFGYFPAQQANSAGNLPGGMVFTCLSFDVVSHETTHALLDGHNRYLAENNHPDTLAFHEAFSDVVALLQRFKFPEVLQHQIANTKGALRKENLLGRLAWQFGQAVGEYGALRDALGSVDKDGVWRPHQPTQNDLDHAKGAHQRGAVLVSAIFDAFVTIYDIRTKDLVRIATGGSGILSPGAIHPDLVNRLAAEAATVAGQLLNICLRALDYCPPVGLTFGEFLRAMITLDSDMVGDDALGYRIAIIEAFRRRGIYPTEVRTLSVESLRWRAPDFAGNMPNDLKKTMENLQRIWMYRGREVIHALEADEFDLTEKDHKQLYQNEVAFLQSDRKYNHFIESLAKRYVRHVLGRALMLKSGKPNDTLAKFLGLIPGLWLEVAQATPTRRVMPNGTVRNEMLVRLVQTVVYDPLDPQPFDPYTGQRVSLTDGVLFPEVVDESVRQGKKLTPFRGGCTLIIDMDKSEVPYIIKKKIQNHYRFEEQIKHRGDLQSFGLREVYGLDDDKDELNPFAMLHRGEGQ